MKCTKFVMFQKKNCIILQSSVLAPHVGLSGMAVQELEKSKHSKIFYWRGKMISIYKINVEKESLDTVQFLDIEKYFQGSQLWCKDFSIFKS